MRSRLATLLLGAILTMAGTTAGAQKGKPNHLLGMPSPYLAQHAHNVVDWYPWGDEALEKAKREDKPIFVSIGYSTCHWCHVMARESFDDDAIGAFLNEHFVSIKIDRERRPDLDDQFMLVTQLLTGQGGWPNSVFLTSDGEPFYAGTYFPPDVFLDLLGQIGTAWKVKRETVRDDAQRLSASVRKFLTHSEAARDLTPEAILSAARSLLADIDDFNGGFGVAPKFPQESALLFMLDQAERTGDSELLTAVTDALDGMIKGGIHDHVGGGFHRYTVDEAWLVPHLEKMLYNQAMIGRLLVRVHALTGRQHYRRAAERAFDYVLARMQATGGGFYSAEDADSLDEVGEKREGAYYVWAADRFGEVLGEDAEFMAQTFNVTADGNSDLGNILHLSELPEDGSKAIETIDAALERLHVDRQNRHTPHRDEKIVVAWNGVMIETLADAARVFNRADYLKAAINAADYILNDMNSENGLKRVSFEGTVGIDAQLQDYAALGSALLVLSDSQESPDRYLQVAAKFAEKIKQRFAVAEAGEAAAYRIASLVEGLGAVLPIDDSEIPAGNALALALFDGLAKRTGDPGHAHDGELLASALSGAALASPRSRGYTLAAASARTQGGSGDLRVLANGKVRVIASADRRENTISLGISIEDGWHINAHKPLEDYFVATEMTIAGKGIDEGTYPEALIKSLKFNGSPLALYEGEMELTGKLPTAGEAGEPVTVKLALQACSDQICLEPQETSFRFW